MDNILKTNKVSQQLVHHLLDKVHSISTTHLPYSPPPSLKHKTHGLPTIPYTWMLRPTHPPSYTNVIVHPPSLTHDCYLTQPNSLGAEFIGRVNVSTRAVFVQKVGESPRIVFFGRVGSSPRFYFNKFYPATNGFQTQFWFKLQHNFFYFRVFLIFFLYSNTVPSDHNIL